MPNCQRCDSDRILFLSAKCSDTCISSIKGKEKDGYAPVIPGICGGDYVKPKICLNCGQVQAKFPIAETDLETEEAPAESEVF